MMPRIIDCVVATTQSNGWPQEVSLMTLGWIRFAGGDYNQETTPEQLTKFKEKIQDSSEDFMQMVKESGVLEAEQESIPLAVTESGTIEEFVIQMVVGMKLHPALAMHFLGAIAYSGGDLKKKIHLPTLSAWVGKVGARHGYQVELTKAEDKPLNITGGVM